MLISKNRFSQFNHCNEFYLSLKNHELNILLIGQQTLSTKLYMHVRSLKLPRRLGNFSFLFKFCQGGLRKGNQLYIPKYNLNILIIYQLCNL